jgi:hypothetical protein
MDPSLDVARYSAVVRAMYGGTFWRGGKDEKPKSKGTKESTARLVSGEEPVA